MEFSALLGRRPASWPMAEAGPARTHARSLTIARVRPAPAPDRAQATVAA
jgi:hypothetical protein